MEGRYISAEEVLKQYAIFLKTEVGENSNLKRVLIRGLEEIIGKKPVQSIAEQPGKPLDYDSLASEGVSPKMISRIRRHLGARTYEELTKLFQSVNSYESLCIPGVGSRSEDILRSHLKNRGYLE